MNQPQWGPKINGSFNLPRFLPGCSRGWHYTDLTPPQKIEQLSCFQAATSMVVPCVSRKSVPTVPTTPHLLGLAINRNLHIYKYIPYIYLHTSYIFILYLVGGFNPSWKIWVRQLGRIIPYIMESKIDVWNHQAEYVNLPPLLYYFHRKCMSTPLGIARRWPLWHGCHQFPQNGAGTGQRAQGLQNRQKQHAKDMELGR
jgi:hypothetical protein